MKCKYTSLISKLIDSELDKEKTLFLKEHLKSCRPCSQEFEELERLREMFAQKIDYRVSEDFRERALSSLPDKKPSLKEGLSLWIDDIFPLTKRLVPIPLILTVLLFLFIANEYKTVLPVTIEDVLLKNHFSQEEMLVLSDSRLSSEVALELLIE